MNRAALQRLARERFEKTGDLEAAVTAVLTQVERDRLEALGRRIVADAHKMLTAPLARGHAIVTMIALREGVTVTKLQDVDSNRSGAMSRVRRICCFALKEILKLSFTEAAALTGMVNHTSARTAVLRTSEDEKAIAREVCAPALQAVA